ncbi:substrate-binding periplasmic protein [Pseudodesulfovibrio indicus]|nr:transporter substrate-binding domain-containing protein [Pseudodesulfovibrio indicus]
MPIAPGPRSMGNSALTRLLTPTLIIAALLGVFLLCCPGARAERVRLTVGVESLDYPPYGSYRNGDYEGFARDLLDSFAAEAGVELVFVPLPVKRLYQEFLETRTLDFKFPDAEEWHPSKRAGLNVLYSDPVCTYTDGILVRPDRLGRGVEGIGVLGIIAGFKPWLLKPRLSPKKLTVSENASISGLLGKALRGRVDAIYVNQEAAQHLLDEMGMHGGLVLDPDLPHTTGDYRLSTIKHPAVMCRFNDFLRSRTPLIDSLKRKHGLPVR